MQATAAASVSSAPGPSLGLPEVRGALLDAVAHGRKRLPKPVVVPVVDRRRPHPPSSDLVVEELELCSEPEHAHRQGWVPLRLMWRKSGAQAPPQASMLPIAAPAPSAAPPASLSAGVVAALAATMAVTSTSDRVAFQMARESMLKRKRQQKRQQRKQEQQEQQQGQGNGGAAGPDPSTAAAQLSGGPDDAAANGSEPGPAAVAPAPGDEGDAPPPPPGEQRSPSASGAASPIAEPPSDAAAAGMPADDAQPHPHGNGHAEPGPVSGGTFPDASADDGAGSESAGWSEDGADEGEEEQHGEEGEEEEGKEEEREVDGLVMLPDGTWRLTQRHLNKLAFEAQALAQKRAAAQLYAHLNPHDLERQEQQQQQQAGAGGKAVRKGQRDGQQQQQQEEVLEWGEPGAAAGTAAFFVGAAARRRRPVVILLHSTGAWGLCVCARVCACFCLVVLASGKSKATTQGGMKPLRRGVVAASARREVATVRRALSPLPWPPCRVQHEPPGQRAGGGGAGGLPGRRHGLQVIAGRRLRREPHAPSLLLSPGRLAEPACDVIIWRRGTSLLLMLLLLLMLMKMLMRLLLRRYHGERCVPEHEEQSKRDVYEQALVRCAPLLTLTLTLTHALASDASWPEAQRRAAAYAGAAAAAGPPGSRVGGQLSHVRLCALAMQGLADGRGAALLAGQPVGPAARAGLLGHAA